MTLDARPFRCYAKSVTRLLLALALVAAPLANLCAQKQEMTCCGTECPSNQAQICCEGQPLEAPLKAVAPQPAALFVAVLPAVTLVTHEVSAAPAAEESPGVRSRFTGLSPPRA